MLSTSIDYSIVVAIEIHSQSLRSEVLTNGVPFLYTGLQIILIFSCAYFCISVFTNSRFKSDRRCPSFSLSIQYERTSPLISVQYRTCTTTDVPYACFTASPSRYMVPRSKNQRNYRRYWVDVTYEYEVQKKTHVRVVLVRSRMIGKSLGTSDIGTYCTVRVLYFVLYSTLL